MKNTFNQSVVISPAKFYMLDNFNVRESTSTQVGEGNVFSRIHNGIVKAIDRWTLLPKLIVIIIDSDATKNFSETGETLEKIAEFHIDALIESIHECIISHKAVLPEKSKKFKYPTVLWMVPPVHINFTDNKMRSWVARCIERSVMSHNEMRFARLHTWDPEDTSTVVASKSGYRFTGRGLHHYWAAVDNSIRFWNKTFVGSMSSKPANSTTNNQKKKSKKHLKFKNF